MNTNVKKQHRGNISRVVSLAALLVGIALVGTACKQGEEGDRCNPVAAANGEDECNSGLSCQMPSTCVENYCCPADPTKSTNPYCNGMLCPPAMDAGMSTMDAGAGTD